MVTKIVRCIDCGREFPRKRLNRKLRCPECSSKAMIEAIRGMAAHEGKYFEKWKAAMKEKGLARLAASLDKL